MLNLEIWIRKGQNEYGCLRLRESSTGAIRYENDPFQFYKSRKKTYNFELSLEYLENQSSWTGGRWTKKSCWVLQGRSDNGIQNDSLRGKYGKYILVWSQFVTSGKTHTINKIANHQPHF